MEKMLQRLPQVLLPWYEEHKRELPWRQDKEPYHIWVSEIMLQQTRVEAVKGYYARFLEKLPTIEDLANAPEELLHKLWEGLGYYSRVQNLKKAAEVIVNTHGGVFPKTYESFSYVLTKDKAVYVIGEVSVKDDDDPKILARSVGELTEDPADRQNARVERQAADEDKTRATVSEHGIITKSSLPKVVEASKIYIRVDSMEGKCFGRAISVVEIFSENGKCDVIFFDISTGKYSRSSLKVCLTEVVLEELKGICGKDNVVVK